MPTETTTRKKIYACNGSQVTFPFTFPIHSENDIVVKVRTTATGVVETLTLTTHYTVTKTGANWDNGGNVVTVATYPNTKTIMIKRVTEQTQTKDYVEGGNFPAESHEEGLDKLTRIVQELQEEVKRCLKMPDTDDEDLDMEIPNTVDRSSKWLGFGPGGEPTGVQTTPDTVAVSPFAETVLDDADAEAACDTLGALDVNNDDLSDIDGDLDDIDDGTTYQRVAAGFVDANGKIEKIKSDCALESATTRYYSVSLIGREDAATIYSNGGTLEWNETGSIRLQVNLPHGAIVTNLYSYAQIADNNIIVKLRYSAKDSDTVADMAGNTHVGTGALNDNTITEATIDNSARKYYMSCNRATHAAQSCIYSIIITYTITEPLP